MNDYDGNDPQIMNRTDDRHNMLDRCYRGTVYHLSIQGISPLFLDEDRKTLSHSEGRALRALLRAGLVKVSPPADADALTLEPIQFTLTHLGTTTLHAWDGERPPAALLGPWRVQDQAITNGVVTVVVTRDETTGAFAENRDEIVVERTRSAIAAMLTKAVSS